MSASSGPPSQVVRDAVTRALAEDLGPLGDLTTVLLPAELVREGCVVARATGVLAGTACFTETYAQFDARVTIDWLGTDGLRVTPGSVVARLRGPLVSILTGERTALNFLCHLSGVATMTRRYVDAAAVGGTARIADTRKTLPGLRALEKAAVRSGGGVNHRGSLSDLVLLKDNHLVDLTIADAVHSARTRWPGRGVEVECDRADQVTEAIAAGADMVMLDNMSPEEAARCVALVRASQRPSTIVEISGGVTLDTVAKYAATGADVISTSAITQSAPALDLGLDLGPDLGLAFPERGPERDE